MPELPELRIMSDFINNSTKGKKIIKLVHIEKGNTPIEFERDINYDIESDSSGKRLLLKIGNIDIHVFMGMSGNWKYIHTNDWNETKFTRLRIDDNTGKSLLLYGGYMGPKYSINKPFTGTKRGPDPTKDFLKFKNNIIDNLDKKIFNNPICDVLLNQEYFSGLGNYLRSTILFYADVNPFEKASTCIKNNQDIIELCRDIPIKSYNIGGGQIKDWSNPFGYDTKEFDEWVFYKKGLSCKDKIGRTFWFDTKWESKCPYKIKNKK